MTKTRSFHQRAARPFLLAGTTALAWLVLVALPSCGGDQCDPGYELKNHSCVPVAASSGGSGEMSSGGAEDAEAGAPTAGSGGSGSACETMFNESCTSADACSCDTNFCAAMPGQTGFCTHDGCLEDPDVCPDGWSCMDLSAFVSGLSMCVE